MRKILTSIFMTVFIILGISVNVQAAEVSGKEALTDALTSSTEETITLTDNINLDAGKVTITGKKTLDLNGKTLTLKDSIIVNGGSLTIKGNGKITTAEADPLINVLKGSTLVLENGTFESTTYYGAAIQVSGDTVDTDVKTKVNIGKDTNIIANYPVFIPSQGGFGVIIDVYGNLESVNTKHPSTNEIKYGAAIYINGTLKSTTGNVPVINVYEGANVIADEGTTAVYAAGYGIWNISGGYFEGTEALSIKGGEFYITGGEFVANGEFIENPTANNNGSESTGSAISVTGNDGYAGNIVLEISNATITSENGYAVYETITNAVQPAIVEDGIKIISGSYSGKQGAIKADNETNFIQGGTFSSGVDSQYLASSVSSAGIGGSNGAIVVGVKRPITVNTVVGGTVEVVKEAISGETITMEPKAQEGYRLKNLKVITVADSNVTVTDNTFVMPDLGVIIIPEFEEIPISEEKDNTPKTGIIDYTTYICIALATIAIVGMKKTNKASKHSK